jgi:hypothetical protein
MNFGRWRILGAALVVAMTPLGMTLAGPYLEEVDRGSFVSHAQLRNWLADGVRGLWIQGRPAKIWLFSSPFTLRCSGAQLVAEAQASQDCWSLPPDAARSPHCV